MDGAKSRLGRINVRMHTNRDAPKEALASANTLVVDTRDAHKIERTGNGANAVNVSHGMVEFRATISYCVAGDCPALPGKMPQGNGLLADPQPLSVPTSERERQHDL